MELVDLFNDALVVVGAQLGLDVNEDSKGMKACNQRWPRVRDAVLRAHPWNCVTARAVLQRESTAPAWGYAYSYVLPADPWCLRVLQMEYRDQEFRVEGRRLLTDETEAKILYIYREENPALYDPLLVEALIARLSAEVCYRIAPNATLVQGLWQFYGLKKSEATMVDAQESSGEVVEQYDSWDEARL